MTVRTVVKIGFISLILVSFTLPLYLWAQQFSLSANFHRQEHSLSCEIATLKMALKVHGIEVSETELIAHLPFDNTPKGNGVWGDPNKGFVGDIDGRMLVDGYGVYWDPIAQVGSRYANAEVMRHGSPQQLARHLKAGNPVIVWGYYGERGVYFWKTPDGTPIKAVNGEHTRLVYGFDGSVDNPTRFYLIDPLSGFLSWSTEELMHNWSSLNHMGVVVAKNPLWVRVPNDTKVWEINDDGRTRRWITSWEAFARRGGSKHAVSPISEQELLTYTVGEPIL